MGIWLHEHHDNHLVFSRMCVSGEKKILEKLAFLYLAIPVAPWGGRAISLHFRLLLHVPKQKSNN